MNLLLDTHAFVWWNELDSRLLEVARKAIADESSVVHVSVATAWEIAIKVGTGKWPQAAPLLAQFERTLAAEFFELLPISIADVRVAGLMDAPHRDPFDRLIATQAIQRGFRLVTNDAKLATLGPNILW